ncbi:pilus assembly protein PilM [Chloroflexota bacterium]
MTGKVVTLYLDNTQLKLLVTSGKRIKKFAELPLELPSAKVSPAARDAELAAKIKQLLTSRKVGAKKIILGLSGLHCLTRPLTLPLLPKAMLDEAIMREAKRALPVPLEQLHVSWQVISTYEGNTKAFIVAIPRNTTDTIIKVLHQVGLKPYMIDIKPLALARLTGEATAIIVDVQPSEFDIVIMVDGIPQPVRTVPFPGEALPPQEKLDMVKNELIRTIEFYNSNNPEKPLISETPLYVSGELVGEPELAEALGNELGFPVAQLVSPLKGPKGLDPSPYLMNVGLALKEIASGKGDIPSLVNVNSLPVHLRPKPVPFQKLLAIPGAAVAAGILILMAMFIQDASATIASAGTQLDGTNEVIKQKQAQKNELIKSIEQLNGKVSNAKSSADSFIAAANTLREQGDIINGDLAITPQRLYAGMSISSISHNNGTLTIQGWAPSEVEVLYYARSLNSTGRFSEITITRINRLQDDGSMDFNLVLKGITEEED